MEVAVQDDSLLLFDPGGTWGSTRAYRRLRGDEDLAHADEPAVGLRGHAEPAQPPHQAADVVYDWAVYDRAIRRARRRGVKVQLTLTGPAPAWATPTRNVDTGYWKPNARLFKKFVKKAAHRYRRKVDRFAIWNEPNWYKWLGPLRQAPRRYRRLYIARYKAIKRKAPRARDPARRDVAERPARDRDRAAQVPAPDDVPEAATTARSAGARRRRCRQPAARRRRRAPSVRLRQVAADEAEGTRRRDDRGARPAQPRAQEDEAPARPHPAAHAGRCRCT